METKKVKIECQRPPPKYQSPRSVIEFHERQAKELKEKFDAAIAAAEKKKFEELQKAAQNRLKFIMWVIISGHVMMILEYYYFWRHIL